MNICKGLVLIFSILLCSPCFSQIKDNGKSELKKDDKALMKDAKKQEIIKWAKISLDASVGTRGAGMAVRYSIDKKWAIRLGFSYFPISYDSKLTISGYTTQINLQNNFTGLQLLADWKPSARLPFRFIGGLAYFTTASLTCTLTPTGNYNFGNLVLTGADVGIVSAKMDWSGVAPFIGFGFGNPKPKHAVGVSLGFGMYYLAQPKVTVTGTNFLSGNDQNAPWLANNIKDYRYLPIVNFHLNYRFRMGKAAKAK